jgi:UDP-N-acetylglucosamine--N-acetylmuramyl-(pentapeptide) pyrophosphoryl-undecaprenol N-acetylglucosamine transferase
MDGCPNIYSRTKCTARQDELIFKFFCKCAFVSYEESKNYFKSCDVIYTGNAIRESFADEIVSRDAALQFFNLSPNKKTLFVTGGSLGARAINEAIAEKIDQILAKDIQVIWHTGKAHYEKFKHLENENCKVFDFIYKINQAYAASDLVVTRAGGVLFELFVVGKPAIVLPSPYVADDHQTPNAEALVKRNAATNAHRCREQRKTCACSIIALMKDEARMKAMSGEL